MPLYERRVIPGELSFTRGGLKWCTAFTSAMEFRLYAIMATAERGSLMTKLLVPLPLLLLLGWATPAKAHAILLNSSPAANSVLSDSSIAISLRFNSRIDGGRSRLTLIGPDSSEHKLEIGPQKSPDTLTAQVQDLKSGSYRVRWQVLAVDGHITRGEIPFRVGLRSQ